VGDEHAAIALPGSASDKPARARGGPIDYVRERPAWLTCNTAHTADLDSATFEAAHALLDAAFDGAFSEYDWDHTLGWLHALAREGSELVGHASVVQRRLLHAGRTLRAGFVEGVGVRANRRGRGYASALLDAVERVLCGAYDAGALSSTDAAVQFYARRGWQRWEGPTSTLSPAGIIPTKDDDGAVYVLRLAVPLDIAGELTCDWRDGNVW